MVPTVAVLMVAGFQVPVIPLVEVAGKTGATLFWHSGPIALKIGAILFVIVISKVAISAH